MEEQTTIITSIVIAFLTGGFILLFLENQHIGANAIERYHFVMKPFMHRLSCYFKFISSAQTFFVIRSGISKEDSEYVCEFRNRMDKLGHFAFPCIMSGSDYPSTHFSAKKISSICEDINNVWYYWDNKQQYIQPFCYYEEDKAEQFGEEGKNYLNEVFPDKYKKKRFSIDLISEVSGKFYFEVYCPMKHIPFEYEKWCKMEDNFRHLIYWTIGLCILILFLVLLFRYFIPIWFLNLLTVLCMALFALSIFKLSKLDSFSRNLFR